jgi:replicative DNA helicase
VIPTSSHAGHYAKLVRDSATQRRFIDAAQQVAELAWVQGVPVADLTLKADALFQRARGTTGMGALYSAEELTTAFRERFDLRDGVTLPGHASGMEVVDAAVLGFQPGRVYLFPARPGMGKSTFAQQIGLWSTYFWLRLR